jgi:hypothetical protein
MLGPNRTSTGDARPPLTGVEGLVDITFIMGSEGGRVETSRILVPRNTRGPAPPDKKQMRELGSRCGRRSGADVGREVLAGEGGTGGDEVGRCALEDDPPIAT